MLGAVKALLGFVWLLCSPLQILSGQQPDRRGGDDVDAGEPEAERQGQADGEDEQEQRADHEGRADDHHGALHAHAFEF